MQTRTEKETKQRATETRREGRIEKDKDRDKYKRITYKEWDNKYVKRERETER